MSFRKKNEEVMTNNFFGKKLEAEEIRRKSNLFDNGMKAGYYSRKGASSFLDRELIKKHLDDEDRALGDGFYTIQMMDADGNVASGVPLNFGGRIYYPNAKDQYTIVDRQFLEKQLQKANEQEEYLNEVIELATASDKSLMTVLGLKDFKQLENLCGAACSQTGNAAEMVESIPKDLRPINCLPSILRLLPKDSLTFSQAVAKLRAILLAYAPIMDTMDTAKTVRENTD